MPTGSVTLPRVWTVAVRCMGISDGLRSERSGLLDTVSQVGATATISPWLTTKLEMKCGASMQGRASARSVGKRFGLPHTRMLYGCKATRAVLSSRRTACTSDIAVARCVRPQLPRSCASSMPSGVISTTASRPHLLLRTGSLATRSWPGAEVRHDTAKSSSPASTSNCSFAAERTASTQKQRPRSGLWAVRSMEGLDHKADLRGDYGLSSWPEAGDG
jgi:hypothetical protein